MVTEPEQAAMRRAIALSAFGLGTTSPNPPVGCVVLDRTGEVVGEGFHERKGEPHAEGRALAMAGARARGGTAVVTLEPCNHEGRAPACRRLLLEAGISRCLIAVLDPTSREEGGVQRLRANGIDVEVDVLGEGARLVLGPWLHAQATGRPFVTWTYTAEQDDTTAPLTAGMEQQARLGTDAVISQDGNIAESVAESHGRGVLGLQSVDPETPPQELMAGLYTAGVRSLLLNADARAAEPYVAAGLVDRVDAVLRHERMDTLPAGLRLVDVRKLDDETVWLRGEFA